MNNQLYQLIPEPAGEWQEGDWQVSDKITGSSTLHRLRPVQAYSGQLWRDLREPEQPQKGDRWIAIYEDSCHKESFWQRPVPATCGPISEKGGDAHTTSGFRPEQSDSSTVEANAAPESNPPVTAQNICQGCDGLRVALDDICTHKFCECGDLDSCSICRGIAALAQPCSCQRTEASAGSEEEIARDVGNEAATSYWQTGATMTVEDACIDSARRALCLIRVQPGAEQEEGK